MKTLISKSYGTAKFDKGKEMKNKVLKPSSFLYGRGEAGLGFTLRGGQPAPGRRGDIVLWSVKNRELVAVQKKRRGVWFLDHIGKKMSW